MGMMMKCSRMLVSCRRRRSSLYYFGCGGQVVLAWFIMLQGTRTGEMKLRFSTSLVPRARLKELYYCIEFKHFLILVLISALTFASIFGHPFPPPSSRLPNRNYHI